MAQEMGIGTEPTPEYKLTHNTIREAIRIIIVEVASILLAALTIPWRLVMNKERRATLDKAVNALGEAKGIIEGVLSDEQDSFDNLPESTQGGEKGEKMQAAIGSMEEAMESIDGALEQLESAKE